jgi:hypothetical protein
MLLWMLLIFGFAGYAWITLGWVSFRLFYDVAGSENIHLDSRENQVRFFKKIKFRLFPGVPLFFEMNFRTQSSSISNTQVNMNVAPSFVDGQIQRRLRLMLNRKKITLSPERSAETKQQLLAYLQETLTLMQTYAAIKTVAFGAAPSGQAGFLQNPDVSELTVGMPELKKLEIYADSYNLHQVEQFLTYAVNEIGRERLQKQVDVVLYGKSEQLHHNLHNNMQHIFKTVSEI